MAEGLDPAQLGLPDGSPLVLTDQRGDGANAGAGTLNGLLPLDRATTAVFAQDIVGIVRQLGLTDYVLFGHSFGTLHATVTAAALVEAGLPPPRAVVLEGVLGRAFRGDEPAVAVAQEWTELLAELSDSTHAWLSGRPPLGASRENWGLYLQSALYFGHHALAAKLETMARIDRERTREPTALDAVTPEDHTALAAFTAALRATTPLWPPLFTQIACREFANGYFSSLELHDGALVQTGALCPIGAAWLAQALQQPVTLDYGADVFDASSFPSPSPLVYINGDDDSATPLYQARHHFDVQRGVARTFVTVRGAGHFPLKHQLAPCRESLWSAILGDHSTIDAALAACPAASADHG